MICTHTLVLKFSGLEAITEGLEYASEPAEDGGIVITNNQGDLHHFSPQDVEVYFS